MLEQDDSMEIEQDDIMDDIQYFTTERIPQYEYKTKFELEAEFPLLRHATIF